MENFLRHNTHAHCILGGDFNGWHPLWGSARTNRRGEEIYDLIQANDLSVCNSGSVPTFETFTHQRQRSSIIDLTLASTHIYEHIKDWKVNLSACTSSQHNAIEFTVAFNHFITHTHTSQHTNTTTFQYKNHKAHWPTFKASLITHINNSTLLDIPIDSLNPDELEQFIDRITNIIHSACKESMPIRTPGSKAKPPWWSEALETRKREVISLHRALHAAKRDGRPTDSLASQLRDIKEQYANELRSESTTSFREFCKLQNKENVWSLTNRLLKESNPRSPPTTLRLNDTYTTDGQDTAQALLNKFYPDDGPDTEPRHNDLRVNSHNDCNTEPDKPFTAQEVLEVLDDMSPKKAPGLDHLTSDICLRFAQLFPNLLTDIYNRCLTLQHFPKQWKRAYVKIIPKPNKTDRTDLNSYRPIGLLPVFGKALEKLFVRRVTFAAMKADKLSESQYGFRPLTSTTAALKAAIDKIRRNKTDGLMTLAVSLDIKAAFDNAWWPALFHRLRLIDCPSNIYGLILNYTTDRTVTLDHAGCRVSKTMTKGCIQGSACGPILWNIILDELLELDLPPGCRLQAFADDVLLVAAAGDLASLQNITNQSLHAIVSWGKGVKLTFSPTKTQAIAFSDKARHANINIDSHALHFQDDIKLLGVVLDSKLLFNRHITHVINKATHIFNKLIMYCRPTWGAHPENIRTIYLQVIQPIITYAAGIWGHVARKKYIRQKLLSLQRGFAIRAIKAFRTVSTVAAISLARFTPLDLKVIEVHRIEMARLTGKCDFLPDDIPLERHIPPHRLLHPADRITTLPKFFYSQPELAEHISSLPHPIITIYTDGSKLEDDSVGAAFVCFEGEDNMPIIRKFKLHNSCSVFQAELFAISQAAGWASEKNYAHTLIFSDSRSAIQATQNRSNTHPLVSKIHNIIHTHTGCIDLAWVKSHADIAGNEIADTMAKLATKAHKAPDYDYFPISFVKRHARESSYSAWNEWYNSDENGRHTHALLPTIDDIHTLFKNTDTTFTLTQALTGHAYNLTYLHRFKITDLDVCPCDNASRQTLEHLLQQCPRFARDRYEHEAVCRFLGFPAFRINEFVKNKHCVQSFAKLADSILSALKEYNNNPAS